MAIDSEVRNIISEIEEKAADGNYIYRGEPEALLQGLIKSLASIPPMPINFCFL